MSDVFKVAGLRPEDMAKTPGYRRMALSCTLWHVLHDEIIPYEGRIRFNLAPGEIPVFGIANVLLKEERTAASYVGGYGGASIRVGRGLYYHLGGARGHTVQSSSIQEVDYGDLLIGTQNVYFGGTEHGTNFRVPYRQVVRFQPYSDGVGICKNGAKEKVFVPQQVEDCGWFLYNVLQALAERK